LMKRYQSIDKIKEASIDDLMLTDSMNLIAAQNVYYFFHKDVQD